MNEIIVLAACISGACTPASRAYYESRPAMQERAEYYEQKLATLAPISPLLSKKLELKHKNSRLILDEDSATLNLTWRF